MPALPISIILREPMGQLVLVSLCVLLAIFAIAPAGETKEVSIFLNWIFFWCALCPAKTVPVSWPAHHVFGLVCALAFVRSPWPFSAVHFAFVVSSHHCFPFSASRWTLLEQGTAKSTDDQSCASNLPSSTTTMSFFSKLEKRIAAIDSHLCVGLDPHTKELFPEGSNANGKREREPTEQEKCDKAFQFCISIIGATGEFSIKCADRH